MLVRRLKMLLGKGPVENPYARFGDVEIQPGCHISHDSMIGAFTYIGFNCTITRSNIGRYCSIANNSSIGIGEHKLNRISTSSHFYDNPYETLTEKDCVIGNDVWIGTNAVIRRGVRIGDGAVIGANAFVNTDVPDFAICVGLPGRIIKYRFSEEQIKLVRQSAWWDLPLEDAKKEMARLEQMLKNGNDIKKR